MSTKRTSVETFDCQGCSPHCYGGYHMEAHKDGLGDYVKAENYQAVKKQRDELMAALKVAISRQAYRHGEGPDWWEQGCAVIAKVEGAAS